MTTLEAIENANRALGDNAIERFGQPAAELIDKDGRKVWWVIYPGASPYQPFSLPPNNATSVYVDDKTGKAKWLGIL